MVNSRPQRLGARRNPDRAAARQASDAFGCTGPDRDGNAGSGLPSPLSAPHKAAVRRDQGNLLSRRALARAGRFCPGTRYARRSVVDIRHEGFPPDAWKHYIMAPAASSASAISPRSRWSRCPTPLDLCRPSHHRDLARCLASRGRPGSNGMSEAFVKAFKRDYVRVSPIAEPLPPSTSGLFLGGVAK
jgi:hypothetical protein